MCHMSHVTRQMSRVTFFFFFFLLLFFRTMWWTQLVEGLLSTGLTPSKPIIKTTKTRPKPSCKLLFLSQKRFTTVRPTLVSQFMLVKLSTLSQPCTLPTALCILRTVHWPILQTAQYKLHTTNCTLQTAHYELHTTNCTLQTAHYKLHTTKCTLQNAYQKRHAISFTLQTAHYKLQTAHGKLHTGHQPKHTGHFI